MKIKNLIFTIFTLCSIGSINSQHALGLMIGDYNSPQSAFLNPALARTNPGYRAYVNWWGSSISLENNFMQYNAPFRLGQWVNGNYPSELVNINGTLAFDQDWLPTYTSVDNWKLNYLNEVYGPAIFVPVDNVGTFGFGVKEVSGFSVNGLNGEFGGILRYGLPSLDANKGRNIIQEEFSINTEKYQEWYMSFAGFNNDDQVNSWRWGLNMKFLLGMGMAHLGSDQLDITVNDRNSIQINQMNARYYQTWGASQTLRNPFGMSFDFLEGAGLGADLGVVYEHRPNGNKPKSSLSYCDFEKNNDYDWKFGMSFTDLGFIYYTGEADDILSTGNTTWNVDQNIVQNGQYVQGDEKFFGISRRLFEPLGADKYYEFASYLPFAFNMQFDKKLNQNWHFGGYWTQNLKRRNSVGLRRASYLSLVPRWQSEQMEFGFPLTIANDYTNIHYGAYGRIGPVIIGSNNLIGLGEFLTNAQYSGGDFYFTVRSKLGGCERRLNSVVFREVTYDTTYKKETVNIEKVIYDTVVSEKVVKVEQNKFDSVLIDKELLKNNTALKAEIDKNNKTINLLNDSINALEDELKKSKATALDLSKKCDEKLEELNKGIELKQKEIDALEEQLKNEKAVIAASSKPQNNFVDTCCSELGKVRSQIIALESEKEKIKSEFESFKSKAEIDLLGCNKKVEATQKILDAVQKELAEEKRKNSELEAENEVLKGQISRLSAASVSNDCEEELSKAQANLLEEKKRNSKILTEKDELEIELAKLKNENAALLADKKKCEENLSKRNSEISVLSASIDSSVYFELLKENKELKNKLTQLELDRDNLNMRYTELLTEKENCEKELAINKSQLSTTEDCAPLRSKIAELELKLIKLEAELSSCENKVVRINAEKDILAKENKECNDALKAKNSEISVSEDCTPFKEKIKELELKILSLQSDFSEATITIEKLNNEIKASIAREKECESCKEKNLELEKEINRLKSLGTGEQQSSDSLNILISKLESQIEKCQSEKAETDKLKSDLEKSLNKVSLLQSQLDSCAKKSSKIEATVGKTDSTDYYKQLSSDLTVKADSLSKQLNDAVLKFKNAEDRLSETGNESQIKLAACEEEKIKLQNRLKICEEDKLKVTESEKALRAQIIQMDGDMYKLGEIIKTNNSEIANQKALIEKLNSQLKECSESLKKSNVDASAVNIPADTTTKYIRIAQELKESQIKIAQLQQEADECKISSKKLEAEKLLCEEKLKNITNEVTAAEDCTPFKNKAAELDAKVKDLEKEAEERNSQIDLLKKKQSELELEISKLSATEDCTPYKEKVSTLERQVKTYEDEIKLLTEQKAQIEAELETEKNKTEDCEPYKQKVIQLQAEIVNINKKLISETNKNEELKKQVSNLEASVSNSSSETEISNLKQSLNEANSKLEASTQKITNLQAELDDCKKSISAAGDLNAEIEALKNEVNNKNQQLEATTSKLNKLTKEKSELQSQIDACLSEKKTCTENESMLRAQIIQMDEDMLVLSKDIQDKNKTIEALREKVGVLEVELKNCNEKLAPAGGGDN